MAFPTLAALDAAIFPALTTEAEQSAVHRTRDGAETPCAAWLVDAALESYTEAGVRVTSTRREIEVQRADVTPVSGESVIVDGVTWILRERIAQDAGVTRWTAASEREADA